MEHEYYCPKCNKHKTLEHGMVSKNDLPDELKSQITCNEINCKTLKNKGNLWLKNISSVGFVGGQADQKNALRKKQAERKLRSKKHFKNEVLPNLQETQTVKNHFKRKFKDI